MNIKKIYSGKWIELKEKIFTNRLQKIKHWEYVSRKNNTGACCIIALKKQPVPSLILIKQFRPPINNSIIEFPAGLMENGETAEETAIRELREETGYEGKITETDPFVYNSPGLTDEYVCFVWVEVTTQKEQQKEEDEIIEVIELPLENLTKSLLKLSKEKIGIDAKVWAFARGIKNNF